jgi:hypothetical protein
VAGNHDVGFGDGLVETAYNRFVKTFGEVNYLFHLGDTSHDFAVLDVVALSSSHASHAKEKAVSLLDQLKKDRSVGSSQRTLILFVHVPLYRPASARCSPLSGRVSSDLHQGRGYQYQNLLDVSLSKEILESLRPSAIFTGDDHDQCLYVHTLNDGSPVPEVSSGHLPAFVTQFQYTVGTFSWLQGNPFPSYGRLYLDPNGHYEFRVCYLPPQKYIYFSYIGAAMVTIIFLYRDMRRKQFMHLPISNTASALSTHQSLLHDVFNIVKFGLAFYVALIFLS